ncbi:MAG: S-methyl-5'-thioadenosine phosphorylase [Candidatus Omnitrophica bacterium]|nr:S-methyl-5'-thioadenosine phosphorylase [Candidatus Omnitrophota bacterium]
MATVGVIGGSGLYQIDGITEVKEVVLDTPFGRPSDAFITGKLEGVPVVFLPRHGRGHRISPTEINYQANIWGMKKLGVSALVSVSAVGSLKLQIKPMDFVLPDQFIDRTAPRRHMTFFSGGIVAHVGLAEPVSEKIAEVVYDACEQAGVTVHKNGTYLNMEGPQFSTKAESNLYRSWGCDIIGMTNLPEAKLAREAEMDYCTLAAVTDYDCWHHSHGSVTVEMIIDYLGKNVENAKKILKLAIPRIGAIKKFSAANALASAIMTDPKLIPDQKKKDLEIIIGKYIK